MNDDSPTVSDLGERGLIARIRERIGPGPRGEVWGGDDAAVLPARAETLLHTIDSLVEGVDFDFAYCSGADVGWKAIAVNASDIAAMGGRPHHAVTALSLPASTPVSVVDDLLAGMIEGAGKWGASLVGGDISEAVELSITVAMTGATPGPVVLRRGARPGDALCVTGTLGGSAGGLEALRRGLTGAAAGRLAARHLRPEARIEAGVRLAEAGATAMIDVSDGLAVDAANLMRASGTGCDIDPDALPVDPDLEGLAASVDPMRAAILGGEDFELLFTIAEPNLELARSALAETGAPVTRVGTVTASERTLGDRPLEAWEEMGWEHLRDR